MTASRVSYALESTLASVNTAEQAALEMAAKSGFDEDECGRIGIAVREAAVNAIYHGNNYDPAKRITVSFESTPESLTITVRDEGPGLDPSTVPDPLAAENFLKSSGRGIFLIRAFMDEVTFPEVASGTEISMKKFVHAPARDSADDPTCGANDDREPAQ
jgi:serine/threonine-protein kinase RsbW